MADNFSNPNAKGSGSGLGSNSNSFENPHCKGAGKGITGKDANDFGKAYGTGTQSFGGSAPDPGPSAATSNEKMKAGGVSVGQPSSWQDKAKNPSQRNQ